MAPFMTGRAAFVESLAGGEGRRRGPPSPGDQAAAPASRPALA